MGIAPLGHAFWMLPKGEIRLSLALPLPDKGTTFRALYAATARGGNVATPYQPRHRNARRNDAVRMADAVEPHMAAPVRGNQSSGATARTRCGDVRARWESALRMREAARMIATPVTLLLVPATPAAQQRPARKPEREARLR